MPPAPDLYDVFAYPGFSYPNSHPDRLATMAILHRLSPAPVERCRVLEVACGDGANLIPIAYAAPASEFVGFDLAGLPVERAQARIRDLGLSNIRVFQGDMLEAGSELGRFDYIVAHGFYSWVPAPVRDRLLALCSELLTPDGIAFVSYNALPGSYLRRILRDAMLFRAQGIEAAERSVTAGMEFLRAVAAARPEGDAYRVLLEDQLRRLGGHATACTFHDELSPHFHPLYFAEFVDHARRHGLEYLCDAEVPPPPDPCYRADLQPAIRAVSGDDVIRHEQALDFFRMRPYRETLLCRADRPIRRGFFPESFECLSVASQNASREGEKPGSRIFELPGSAKMETSHAAVIWLLEQLGRRWPHALSIRELKPRLADLGLILDNSGTLLLTRLVISRMVELRAWNPPLADSISARPRAGASARQEARDGSPATTFLHLTLKLDEPKARALLMLLDGTRTRPELVQAMQARFPDSPARELEEGLDLTLRNFYESGMLEA
ncbi:MAG: methyltransferase regulatory domain-containing protein [Terracidiphilus sp.]